MGLGRARLLARMHEPLSTSELAAETGLALATVSHHLSRLRTAGLVQASRDGARRIHSRTPVGDALVT
ncbi:helix-turn-helix domain-containing protein [Microbacterium terregens]|uniref:Helix-turn-helix domain-containing protein n=1 Tax=Microbacterium terregens TaxID=69363 RepID=A0ABV5T0J5_9MICO